MTLKRVILCAVFAMAVFIVLSARKSKQSDSGAARLQRVASIVTNGDHLVLFRFQAPPNRSAAFLGVGIAYDKLEEWPAVRSDPGAFVQLAPGPMFSVAIRPGHELPFAIREPSAPSWHVEAHFLTSAPFFAQLTGRIRNSWKAKDCNVLLTECWGPSRQIISSERMTNSTPSYKPPVLHTFGGLPFL